jgi:hypothetical protein
VRHEIQRIEPRTALRVGFFVGLLLGFVIGLFEAAVFKSMSGVPGASALPADMQQLMSLSGSSIIMLAIVTSLMFSLIMALFCSLGAVFYNWAARLFGGIEFYLSDEEHVHDEPHGESGASGDNPDA